MTANRGNNKTNLKSQFTLVHYENNWHNSKGSNNFEVCETQLKYILKAINKPFNIVFLSLYFCSLFYYFEIQIECMYDDIYEAESAL
jgi:hypothetical protein